MIIQLNNAKCTGLALVAPVTLAKEDATGNEFLIEAYTGETVERWWGMLAIDVAGIKAKKQIPVLMNHDSDKIVGHSTKTYQDGSFFVGGKFSGVTPTALEVKALAAEGFPWQASIGVRPLKIMSLAADATMEVNGKEIKGPAEVWLESEVCETSFVPLGADANTSVSTFSKFTEQEAPQGETQLKKELLMKYTLEELMANAPVLLAEIQAKAKTEGLEEGLKQGAEAEKKRIQEVLEQSMPGHETIVQALAFDGKTTGPEAAMKVLAAEKLLRTNALEGLSQDGIKPVFAAAPVEPQKDPATKEAFEANVELKAEFGDFETYSAYRAAESNGQIKTLKNRSDK